MIVLQVVILGDEKYQKMYSQQLPLHPQAWHLTSVVFKEKVRQTPVQSTLGRVGSSSEQEDEHTSLTYIYLTNLPCYSAQERWKHLQGFVPAQAFQQSPSFLSGPAWPIYYIL